MEASTQAVDALRGHSPVVAHLRQSCGPRLVEPRRRQPSRTRRPSSCQPSRAIRPTVSTSIARSATLIRSCRVSTVSSSSHRHHRLGDDRAGVDPVVDDEQRRAGDLDAVRQRVGRPVHAGERRAQRRVGVDDPAGEPGEELVPDQLHEAGQHDQVGLEGRHRVGERPVPVVAGGEVADLAARTSGCPPGRRGPAPRCRRGRRPRRPPGRRTPGRRRRRAGPGGWCRSRRRGRRGERSPGGV